MSPASSAPGRLDDATHRTLGKSLFNHVWTLLDQDTRTPEETGLMIHACHASNWHWRQVGEPVHFVRGEWQLSRVYAEAKRAEPARYHGQRCLELCQEHGIADFDLAFAHEALARAARVAGDAENAISP